MVDAMKNDLQSLMYQYGRLDRAIFC